VTLEQGAVSGPVIQTCDTGVMLGGGASLSSDAANAAIQSSNPIINGWSASAVGTGPTAVTQTLTVFVVCSGPAPTP
jgi:hypothetical protein